MSISCSCVLGVLVSHSVCVLVSVWSPEKEQRLGAREPKRVILKAFFIKLKEGFS